MSQDPDDKFLDVLAGRSAPDDMDTRRAARLRSHFQRHPSPEERPRHDPQGEAQLLAYLRARQAAQPRGLAAVPSPANSGWLQRLGAWLFPEGGGAGLRQAGLALGVMGLAVAVLLVVRQPEGDDSASMKGLPRGSELQQPPASRGAPAGPGQVMRAADPAATVAALQALLMARSVASTVTPQPDGSLLLQAIVPPQALADLAAALQQQGLNLPPDGQLAVRVLEMP